MKIGEVLKRENVGKLYSDGQYIFKVVKSDEKELYDLERTSDGLLLGDIYYTSKILSMDLIEKPVKEVDWSNIPIDTKVLVSTSGEEWVRRYFAKYENGKIYVWDYGATSFSSNRCTEWTYTKLYKEEEDSWGIIN